jgi:hypothetical protein
MGYAVSIPDSARLTLEGCAFVANNRDVYTDEDNCLTLIGCCFDDTALSTDQILSATGVNIGSGFSMVEIDVESGTANCAFQLIPLPTADQIETQPTTGGGGAQQPADASPSRRFPDSAAFQQSFPPRTAEADPTDRLLPVAQPTIETAETDQTAEAQSADSVAGSGGGAVSAIHPRSDRFVQSAADRQTFRQQTVQLRQPVGSPPSLAFQGSTALTAAAEMIRDLSDSANAQHKQLVSVGGIVGIIVSVAAAVAVAVIAVAYFVFASRRKAAESAVSPQTEMCHISFIENTSATFASENAPSENESENWSDKPDEDGFSACGTKCIFFLCPLSFFVAVGAAATEWLAQRRSFFKTI